MEFLSEIALAIYHYNKHQEAFDAYAVGTGPHPKHNADTGILMDRVTMLCIKYELSRWDLIVALDDHRQEVLGLPYNR